MCPTRVDVVPSDERLHSYVNIHDAKVFHVHVLFIGPNESLEHWLSNACVKMDNLELRFRVSCVEKYSIETESPGVRMLETYG